MKKVYLVRHGETNGNIEGYWQGPDEPLNSNGLKQAAILAERISKIKIDKAIVSTMHRTKQTAAAITMVTSLEFEESDLFRENKAPSCLHSDDAVTAPHDVINQYRTVSEEKINDPLWHFDDEENPTDFFIRIEKAVNFLESLDNENILVVTHGNFIRCFTSYLLKNKSYTGSDFYAMKRVLKTINTGITCFVLEDYQWQLLTWNDHAHFAE